MRLLTICAILLYSSTAPGQSGDNKVIYVKAGFLPGRFSLIEVDHLGNIYGVTKDGYLKKFNAAGDSIAGWYNVRARGIPTAIDVSNPMRILLYYRNYATVVVLDRLLVQRNLIDLRQQQIFSVHAIANAYDNNIWVFDEQDFKLKKINEDGTVLFESADWRMLFPESPLPVSIMDMRNLVFFYDPKKGIWSFDYYGSFKSSFPNKDMEYAGMNNGMIYGILKDKLIQVNTETGNIISSTLPLLKEKLTGFRWMNENMYLLTEAGINILKPEKP